MKSRGRGGGYSTDETAGNTRFPNSRNCAWIVIARRLGQSTNWWTVTCTGTRVYRLVTSRPYAERYEETMLRLERITRAGYTVKVMLECEFEETLCLRHELQTYLLVEIGPLRTRDALYDGRTEVMRLHYRVKEGGEETIQYIDIMSLYPWVCKYFKFPWDIPRFT